MSWLMIAPPNTCSSMKSTASLSLRLADDDLTEHVFGSARGDGRGGEEKDGRLTEHVFRNHSLWCPPPFLSLLLTDDGLTEHVFGSAGGAGRGRRKGMVR